MICNKTRKWCKTEYLHAMNYLTMRFWVNPYCTKVAIHDKTGFDKIIVSSKLNILMSIFNILLSELKVYKLLISTLILFRYSVEKIIRI